MRGENEAPLRRMQNLEDDGVRTTENWSEGWGGRRGNGTERELGGGEEGDGGA